MTLSSKENIKKAILLISEKWEKENNKDINENLPRILSDPSLCSKEDLKFISILFALKKNTKDFDIVFQNSLKEVTSYREHFDQIISFIEMGDLKDAYEKKNKIIERFPALKIHTESKYINILKTYEFKCLKTINLLISEFKYKEAYDFLDKCGLNEEAKDSERKKIKIYIYQKKLDKVDKLISKGSFEKAYEEVDKAFGLTDSGRRTLREKITAKIESFYSDKVDRLISIGSFEIAYEEVDKAFGLTDSGRRTLREKITAKIESFYSDKVDLLISEGKHNKAQNILNSSVSLRNETKKNLEETISTHKIKRHNYYELKELFLKESLGDALKYLKKVNLLSENEIDFLEDIKLKIQNYIVEKDFNKPKKLLNDFLPLIKINTNDFKSEMKANVIEHKAKYLKKIDNEIKRYIKLGDFDKAAAIVNDLKLPQNECIELELRILELISDKTKKDSIQKKIIKEDYSEVFDEITNSNLAGIDLDFIREELKKALQKKLFDSNIDSDQATSLICDKQFQLISARAGSGKTTTLINKVKLLIAQEKITSSEFLFLAFNRKVRDEIASKISKIFKAEIEDIKKSNVHTFHSFSKNITLNVFKGFDLAVDDEMMSLYKRCFLKCLGDNQFKSLYQEYLNTIREPEIDTIDRSNYEDDEGYFLAKEKMSLLTLDNCNVKSLPEKLIGDFFYEHDIAYKYEPTLYTKESVIYRPDFKILHLTNHEDKPIFIEYWGLAGDDSYDRERERKLDYWKKQEKYFLLEIFKEDIVPPNINPRENFKLYKEEFFKRLRALLSKNTGIKAVRLSQAEIMKRISETFKFQIENALKTYMNHVKNNQINSEELNQKINKFSDSLTKRAKAFLQLGYEFRKAIHKEKMQSKKYEFSDTVVKARDVIRSKENLEILRNKKYLFVDEFQDLNSGFMKILKSILEVNPSIKIICVGDDWQSINSFMGAKLLFFRKLNEHFPSLQKNYILTNYRSKEEIVDYGNTIMSGRGDPSLSFNKGGNIFYLNISEVKKSKEFNLYLGKEHQKFDDGFRLERYHKLLFILIKKEIKKIIKDKSIEKFDYFPEKNDFLILSRKRELNSESLGRTFIQILIMSLSKEFASIFSEEKVQNIELKLKKLVRFKTIHEIKGGEAKTVFLIDADKNNMPLRHPDRELSSIFYDNPNFADKEADEEERRIYYVGATRAKNTLYIISGNERSEFMMSEDDKEFTPLEDFYDESDYQREDSKYKTPF